MTNPVHPPAFSLSSRSTAEEHRAATPLELMFDLASVIAIAAAAAGLHHAFAESHLADGIVGFLYSFFMIWIAWLNYTWFASAYDDGSVLFRVLSMVIMFGALVLAAGIPAVFAGGTLYITLSGFVIMRVCLIALWLAAARGDSKHRPAALRYALGITVVQIFWIMSVLLVPMGSIYTPIFFFMGVAMELAIPAFAEHKISTAWHKHHIVERHSLLNIIVLGECFLAIVMAIREGSNHGTPSWDILEIGVLASIITFILWALYFSQEEHLHITEKKHTMLWGYGHFALFASAAAAGAGFAVMVELATHHSNISEQAAALSVAVPVAVYVVTLWMIRDRHWMKGVGKWQMPGAAAIIVLAGVFPVEPLLVITVILAVLIIARSKNLKQLS
ncbi:MAG: low temperature requirement protein A [Rhizobiaceae bacterium]|nr:low temperature requirement protein A [Rhizobiaceae bacterium]